MKSEKGITLVSLAVTMFITIILAGVTIQYTIGENGFVTKSKEAKQNTLYSIFEANEIIENAKIENDINSGTIIKSDTTAPTITKMESTVNGTTVTINVVVSDQESGIKSIQYSKDDGTTWENDYKDIKAKKYVFSGLESGKSYNIKVKVIDIIKMNV